jgi:ABC-type transporter Mla MlaB component
MLRISVLQSSEQVMSLRVEGEVAGRWVEELRKSCEGALSRSVQVALDLAGVSFIDVDGIALLRGLMDRRVVLTNLSSFIAEQLADSTHNGHRDEQRRHN